MAVTTIARRPANEVPPAIGSQPGHNRPIPSEDAVREFEDMLSQRDGFTRRLEDLLASSDRAVAHDPDTAARCSDLVKQIVAAERVIEDTRKLVKEPYLEAGRAVDAAAKGKSGALTDAKGRVSSKLSTFVREEEEKRRAEQRRAEEARQAEMRRQIEERRKAEAKQRAKEDAARIANLPPPEPITEPEPIVIAEAAPAPEPTRIRSDYGALTSAKIVWKHEITDWTVAFMEVENNERVRDAIDKAIGSMVRGGTRKIEGVRVYSETIAQVR